MRIRSRRAISGTSATRVTSPLTGIPGLVRKIETTAANVHDVTQVAGLMDGTEEELYGDSGYLGAEKREEAILTNGHGKEIQYIICARPSSLKKRYARCRNTKRLLQQRHCQGLDTL